MTITTTNFPNFRLTDAEAMILALTGARGTIGLDTYGKLSSPAFDSYKGFTEAFISLDRFGLIGLTPWDRSNPYKTRGYVLTEAGRERYEAGVRRAARYGGCPGCTLLDCVCSHRIGCLVHDDPLVAPEVHTAPLGCTGTHD